MIPRLTIGGGELVAIPAVHYRSIFAEQVNRACRDEATRPEAIAVELSQSAVNAVSAWMKELGVGKDKEVRIPTMLGLVKTNRRIHPRYKEAAMRLQELHGVPLHQLKADILQKELHYSAVALLCLSTTDSIIEAIRSALELDIPVFGVDLGEIACPEYESAMIQDPLMAQTNLTAYVKGNEEICDENRDGVIDGRREQVMVAQLKRLLAQYRRVLFTGGLGHWFQLRRRLIEDGCAPAINSLPPDDEHFSRVVVAPSLAIHQMDLFPSWTMSYEAIRQLPVDSPQRMINYTDWVQKELATTFAEAQPKNREGSAAYLNYLQNLCLVQPCLVPNLFMALHTAESMFAPAFGRHLAKALITSALPWAMPEEWPGLPYLDGAPANHEESSSPMPGHRAELRTGNRRSRHFYLNHGSNNENSRQIHLPPWDENEKNGSKKERSDSSASNWIWPPCESLMFGIAYEAASRGKRKTRSQSTEPFTGSLHNGVHVKATLRAMIRGEKQIHIKTDRCLPSEAMAQERNEPSVFIFEPDLAVPEGRWDTFLAGDLFDIRLHTRNRARLEQVISQHGDSFIASVHFCTDREPRPELKPHVCELRYLYGVVLFGQPALNPVQSASWLEESHYAGCPILPQNSIRTLFEHYQRKHQLILDRENWPVSLIRIALPYAKQAVTIIAPKEFKIPAQVQREAAVRRISLNRSALSDFPPEQIHSIRHQHLVRPLDVDNLKYPPEVEAAFGESPRQHLELLPGRIREQLKLAE